LVTLEDRLAPGDTILGAAVGWSFLGSNLLDRSQGSPESAVAIAKVNPTAGPGWPVVGDNAFTTAQAVVVSINPIEASNSVSLAFVYDAGAKGQTVSRAPNSAPLTSQGPIQAAVPGLEQDLLDDLLAGAFDPSSARRTAMDKGHAGGLSGGAGLTNSVTATAGAASSDFSSVAADAAAPGSIRPFLVPGGDGVAPPLLPDGSNRITGFPSVHPPHPPAMAASIKTVGFSGGGTIYRDTGNQDPYGYPQWVAGDHSYPVTYGRNGGMILDLSFSVTDPGAGGPYMVQAAGTDGVNLPPTSASLSSDQTTLIAGGTTTSLPNQVTLYDNTFTFSWQVSDDGGQSWSAAGTSTHQLYVTLNGSINDAYTPKTFHTVIHRATQAANGETTEAGVRTKVWGLFPGLNVRRLDGTQLTYYANWLTRNTTTATLLKFGDGQCGSWTSLFLDMLKSQGLQYANDYDVVRGIPDVNAALSPAGFIVKNWSFVGAGTNPDPVTNVRYPYYNTPRWSVRGDVINFGGGAYFYDWATAEVNDLAGIPGQGTANPASMFNNHQVAVIGGTYYDPSYGVTYANLMGMQTNAIDGLFRWGRKPVTGQIIFVFQKTPAALAIRDDVVFSY
jgi:hypothetical protein